MPSPASEPNGASPDRGRPFARASVEGRHRRPVAIAQRWRGGQHGDLAVFPSLDPVDERYVGEGRELAVTTDEREALQMAEQLTGAAPGRWVNFAVAGEDYLDYVRARGETTA
jgi:hypothetical protein